MREMKDSGVEWIGEIPKNWEIKRLKAVLCERKTNNNPIKTDFILSLTNDRGVIPYAEKGEVGNKSKDDLTGYKLAYPNDIVLNSMNVIIGSVALSAYYGCVSPVYYLLYPRYENDSVRYYNYLFQTRELQERLKGYGNGIMEIRMRIPMSKLNTVELPIPPNDIQNHISDYLDVKCNQIDTIIIKQRKVIEKLKEYKLSFINETIKNGIGTKCHLGYIGTMKNGLNFSSTLEGKKIKFLGVGDFQDNFILDKFEMFSDIITTDEISEEYMLKEGDIIFVRSNGSKELVGRAVMVKNIDFLLTYSGFCIRFRNTRPEIIDSSYLLYFFRSLDFRKQLEKYSQGSNINNVNQELLSQIDFVFPDMEMQKRIVSILTKKCNEIDTVIKNKLKLIDRIKTYKKSLIYEVVTGKKEIKV